MTFPGRGVAPEAAVKLPERRDFPVILYLDGSGCRSVVHVLPYLQPLVDRGYAVIAPEKAGVRPGDDGARCTRRYWAHDSRQERQLAATAVIEAIPKVLGGWNGKLLIVAASEVTTFAAAVGRKVRDLRGMVLLGGGGWTQARELQVLQALRLEAAGKTEPEVRSAARRLREQMDAIVETPRADRMWRGATYRRWASYLDYDPMPDLLSIAAPIYVANGARDSMVPIESARAIATAFRAAGKTGLTIREYPRLDHRWNDEAGASHFVEVGRDVLSWIAKIPGGGTEP